MLFAAVITAGLIINAAPAQSQESQPQQTKETQQTKPCRWWQFGHCNEQTVVIEGLPSDAPKVHRFVPGPPEWIGAVSLV